MIRILELRASTTKHCHGSCHMRGLPWIARWVLVTQKSSPKSENVVCMTDRVHQRAAEAENYDLGHTVGHARIVSPGIAPEAQQVPLSISKVVGDLQIPTLWGRKREEERVSRARARLFWCLEWRSVSSAPAAASAASFPRKDPRAWL